MSSSVFGWDIGISVAEAVRSIALPAKMLKVLGSGAMWSVFRGESIWPARGFTKRRELMAKFYYQKTHKMEARNGNKFATTYYKQTLEQRHSLTKHIRASVKEIVDYLDTDPEMMSWAQNTPLKGFPKTTGGKRTLWELLTDIASEASGKKRDGTPKDYAQAPIDRWNKLFADTDYEITLEENLTNKKTTFEQVFDFGD
jgi:hypothetical protein